MTKDYLRIAFLLYCIFSLSFGESRGELFAQTTKTSNQPGNFSNAAIWTTTGSGALTTYVIASTHTVTLTAPTTIDYIDIQSGAVLDNAGYAITIQYGCTNNGIHNGNGGYIIGIPNYHMTFDGSGISNCSIQTDNTGGEIFFLSTCGMTINGNIIPNGFNPVVLDNYGNITFNGNITIASGSGGGAFRNYTGAIFNQTGNTTLNDNTWVENYAEFNIYGNLILGGSAVYNVGQITIGGDLLGIGINASLFLQEDANVIARFGGRVFPPGNDGNLTTTGIGDFGFSVEPNTVEYNGGAAQNVKKPSAHGAPVANTYSNLIISNAGTKTLDSTIIINGDLTIQNAATLDVSATPYNIDLKGNWTNTSTASLTERTGTVTLSNSSPQTITTTGGETFYNLILSGTSTKTLAGNIAVNGDLTLQNSAQLDVSATPYNVDIKGNWVNSSTNANPFLEQTGTVTFSGTSAQAITASPVSGGENFYNLCNSNTSGNVSLNNDVTVNNALSFTNGKFILGTKNLTLSTPTAITGYSSSNYVVTDNTGVLQINSVTTPAITFPVGISTSSYTPATIHNNGAGATATNFSVRVADKVYSAQGNVQVADMVDRTWHITGSGGNADATLTLQWNAAEELVPFNRASCGISHFNSPVWDTPSYSAAGGAGPFTQSRSGISTFSPFAVEAATHPLPIELIDFTAECAPSLTGIEIPQIVLNWTTASELNNAYFILERSYDLLTWAPIGKIDGAGNSERVLNYSLVDSFTNSSQGTNPTKYYRLTQTDYNGDSKTSDLISCSCASGNIMKFEVYPIPASESISIDFMNFHHQNLTIQIVDIYGRVIKKEVVNDFNNNVYILDISKFNSGRYFLKVNDLTKSENVIFIKK